MDEESEENIRLPAKRFNLPYFLLLCWNDYKNANEIIELFERFVNHEELDISETYRSLKFLKKLDLINENNFSDDKRKKSNRTNIRKILEDLKNILNLNEEEENVITDIFDKFDDNNLLELKKFYLDHVFSYEFIIKQIILIVSFLILNLYNKNYLKYELILNDINNKLRELSIKELSLLEFLALHECKKTLTLNLDNNFKANKYIGVNFKNDTKNKAIINDILMKISMLLLHSKTLGEWGVVLELKINHVKFNDLERIY